MVLDELGYLALPDGAAELVFQVISERNERGSLIVTTNLPFGEWTKVFPDPRLAKAVVDRITHKAHIIDTGTESWRFRHGLERQRRKTSMTPRPDSRARGYRHEAPRATRSGLRDDSRGKPSNRAIRQHQHQQQPTRSGATSSVRAGATANGRGELDRYWHQAAIWWRASRRRMRLSRCGPLRWRTWRASAQAKASQLR